MNIEFLGGPEDGRIMNIVNPPPIWKFAQPKPLCAFELLEFESSSMTSYKTIEYQLILFLNPLSAEPTPKYVWMNPRKSP